MKTTQFTVYIEQDEDGVFVGSIPSVPGCHAEGKTQAEMMKNLAEVLQLCLRNVNKAAGLARGKKELLEDHARKVRKEW